MLRSLRLTNFRCYEDTGRVEFKKLNLFIGANNAGKSSFLSGVELMLHSGRPSSPEGPLAFSSMASFASFDAVLRRHWSTQHARPVSFDICSEWDWGADLATHKCQFKCKGLGDSDSIYVSRAEYMMAGRSLVLTNDRAAAGRLRSTFLVSEDGKPESEADLMFSGIWPMYIRRGDDVDFFADDMPRMRFELIRPFRPVPRSYYVMDDPALDPEERGILKFLVDVWQNDDDRSKAIRSRIEQSFKTLGLATTFRVVKASNRIGPRVVEIRVSPTIARHRVTIADAGFGVSQVLPLVTADARLSKGYCITYQPEVHLHPKAQSRLADMFVDSAARGNQLFIETHSVDLVLRLQSKIAAGEISPDDVAVFCFENKKGKSSINAVSFKEGGSPRFPWPAGFLDTSLNLARDLVQIRQKAAGS